MSGNTRGKLKEHFEGMHRNFDWVIEHVAKSQALIVSQLQYTEEMVAARGDEEKERQVIEEYPLYTALSSLAVGVQTLDGFVNDLYSTL